jgi:hypothetical protein
MVNYNALRQNQDYATTWDSFYDGNLANAIEYWLRTLVYLPCDHYDIIVAYTLMPSALCKIVPYLFLYGESGSGKSTIGNLISKIYGIQISSSGDSFAGIRNSLNKRKFNMIEIDDLTSSIVPIRYTETETNTCMVWDDIDPKVFSSNPDIYRLFKFGYDRSSDKIEVSSDKTGENLEFHCFCPKIFSSVFPLHLSDGLIELRRRLIVVPTAKIQDLSPERQEELGVVEHLGKGIHIDDVDWASCPQEFQSYWDLPRSELWLKKRLNARQKLIQFLRPEQVTVCADLATTGVVAGIWKDFKCAGEALQNYYKWFEAETLRFKSDLSQVLDAIIAEEKENAREANIPLEIHNKALRYELDNYDKNGWFSSKPTAKDVALAMSLKGFYLTGGIWKKRDL